MIDFLNERDQILNRNEKKENDLHFDSSIYQKPDNSKIIKDSKENNFVKDNANYNKIDNLNELNELNDFKNSPTNQKSKKRNENKNSKLKKIGSNTQGNGNLDVSTKISLESSFTQVILRDYLKNLNRSMTSLIKQMSTPANELCFGLCFSTKHRPRENFNFKPNVNYYTILKSNLHQIKHKNLKINKANKTIDKIEEDNNRANNKFNNLFSENNFLVDSLSISNEDPDFFQKMDNTIILNNNFKLAGTEQIKANNGKSKENNKENEESNFKEFKSKVKISKISLVQSKLQNKSIFRINLNTHVTKNSSYKHNSRSIIQNNQDKENDYVKYENVNNMGKYIESVDEKDELKNSFRNDSYRDCQSPNKLSKMVFFNEKVQNEIQNMN